jgi:hypothetical protein
MKRKTSWIVLLWAVAVTWSATGFAQEASYAIPWSVVVSGGGSSSGGIFTLSATIDAVSGNLLSGGDFDLTGAFWSVPQPSEAPRLEIFSAAGVPTLIWSASRSALQQADTPLGPWVIVAGASSPYSPPLTGQAKFFRLMATGP